jgi:polar amino acid transport system substrate-binding protein
MGVAVNDGARTTDQNFQMLLKERYVGYAHQDVVADHYLKAHGLTNVEKLPIPLVTKAYFLMFSHQYMKKNPQLAEKLWTRIGEIRDTVTKEVVPKYSK